MNTTCNKCIFLDNIDDMSNNSVPICTLDKLYQYEKKGIEIVNINGVPNIKGMVCPFKRDKYWQKKFLTNVEFDDIEDYIIQENGFPYSAFIYEKSGLNIELAVDDLLSLDHAPQYIHITFNYGHQDKKLMTKLSSKIESNKTTRYKLVINLEKDLDNFYTSFLAFALNVLTPFISIHFGDAIIPKSITTTLSRCIQKDLLSFPYADTENRNFVFFPTSIIKEYMAIEGPLFIERIFQTQCHNYQF